MLDCKIQRSKVWSELRKKCKREVRRLLEELSRLYRHLGSILKPHLKRDLQLSNRGLLG
jgi:hypothetical protein